jgi:hypothetical protein
LVFPSYDRGDERNSSLDLPINSAQLEKGARRKWFDTAPEKVDEARVTACSAFYEGWPKGLEPPTAWTTIPLLGGIRSSKVRICRIFAATV